VTRRVRQLLVAILCLLAAQFLIGMTANLYARIPPALPGMRGNIDTRLGSAARWALLRGPVEIKLHVAVGLAIGACAIAAAVLAIRSRQRSLLVFVLLGLVTAVGAGLSGAAFLAYRQDNTYSMLMSAAFLGSVFCYWTGLYLSRGATAGDGDHGAAAGATASR
jgi:hypothetical protein